MRHNKFLSAAIVLCTIALFTTSWKPFSRSDHRPVTITAVFDYSTFPNVKGTFTTSGALRISGNSTMDIHPYNSGGPRAHCVVVLTAKHGTITIHQQCQFITTPANGKWQIVSGTGRYAGLNGNGSLLMPPNTEAMTGFINSSEEEHHSDEEED